jgi:ribosomal protein S25
MPLTSELPTLKKDKQSWLEMVEAELKDHFPDEDSKLVFTVASKLAESIREGGGGQCTTSPSIIASNLKIEVSEVHAALEKLEKIGVVSEYNPAGFQGSEENWKRVDIGKGIGTQLLICHEIT